MLNLAVMEHILGGLFISVSFMPPETPLQPMSPYFTKLSNTGVSELDNVCLRHSFTIRYVWGSLNRSKYQPYA